MVPFSAVQSQATSAYCEMLPTLNCYIIIQLDIKMYLNQFFLFHKNRYEYHWADGHTIKRPIKCSAPKYIDYLMSWVQDQLDDETLFPSKIGKNGFCVVVRKCP